MTGRTHILVGATIAVAFLTFQRIDTFGRRGVATAAGRACLGAVLPDVGRPKSLLRHRAEPVRRCRGLARSQAAPSVACAGLSWLCASREFPVVARFAVLLGYLSHLALDFLMPGGVLLFSGPCGAAAWACGERLLRVALLVVRDACVTGLRLAVAGAVVLTLVCKAYPGLDALVPGDWRRSKTQRAYF